ncbi:hypothetical protein BJ944DRAFT_229374 [Cunninghamella echinulata]|nr:hypothetical protein BJ944DRAFT_229374 [Cunninghamella echinulata]
MTNYDNYGFVNNLTLEMVLNDESPSPYSLKEFIKYLKQTYCTENLDFYRDVTEYKSVCYSFFGPFLQDTIVEEGQEQEQENHHGLNGVKLSNGQLFYFRKDQEHWLNNEEKIFFHHLIIKFNKIMENYIFNNATKEINIPFDLKQQLLYYYSNQHYHPHILHPAYASIIELLRISAFIPFITDTNRFPLSPSSSTSSASSSASDYINDLTTSTAIMSITTTTATTMPAIIDSNNINNQNKYHMTDPTSSSIISTTSITSTSSQQHLSLPWNPRRLKSSPSLNTSLSTCTTLNSESSVFPPLPKSSLSSSTKNKDKDDSISIHSTKSNRFLKLPSPTSPTSEQSNFFIKKVISSTLKKRPSPNNNNSNSNNTAAATNASKPFTRPAGNWTRIQVQDKSIFQQPPKSTTTASMISNNSHKNDGDDIAISFNVPLN